MFPTLGLLMRFERSIRESRTGDDPITWIPSCKEPQKISWPAMWGQMAMGLFVASIADSQSLDRCSGI